MYILVFHTTHTNKRLLSIGIHHSEIYLEIRKRHVFCFAVTLYIYLLAPLMYILVYTYLQISHRHINLHINMNINIYCIIIIYISYIIEACGILSKNRKKMLRKAVSHVLSTKTSSSNSINKQ